MYQNWSATVSTNGKQFRSKNTIYKCTFSAESKEDKVYISVVEGEKSFEQKRYAKETSLSKYLWGVQPSLKWSLIKTVSQIANHHL